MTSSCHIAAANPQFVRRDEVPTDNLEKEREVLTQQALNEGKPAKIVERMVEGRIEKYYKEVCLLEQPFVKDPDINVTKMLGGKADVVRFVRFERGEGLEKRQDNLAADIAAEPGQDEEVISSHTGACASIAPFLKQFERLGQERRNLWQSISAFSSSSAARRWAIMAACLILSRLTAWPTSFASCTRRARKSLS